MCLQALHFVVTVAFFFPIEVCSFSEHFAEQKLVDEQAQPELPLWNETWRDRLKSHLLYKYDKYSRPSHHDDITTVELSMTVKDAKMDDATSTLILNCWIATNWADKKLKWDPSEFGGITELQLGSHELWQPDLYTTYSTGREITMQKDTFNVVRHNGSVLWVPPLIIRTPCQQNVTYWPFETQECQVQIAAWSHSFDLVDLTNVPGSGLDTSEVTILSEWNLDSATFQEGLHHGRQPRPVNTMVYTFVLSRSAELYYHLIFVPILPIIFFILSGFWLRPYSRMRLALNACTLITTIIMIGFLGQKVPPNVDSMPIIVKFYTSCLYHITISTIISTLMINLSLRSPCQSSVPNCLTSLLLSNFGKYLGLYGILEEARFKKLQAIETNSLDDNNSSFDTSLKKLNAFEDEHIKWILLATAIDRLSFLIFCISLSTIAFKYIY